MSKATTKEKPKTELPPGQPEAQLPATLKLRLPYPKSLQDWAAIDQRGWHVLIDVIFPLARTVEAIILAVEYCRSRNLDIMKKVVHIVPMRRKDSNGKWETVDTIWPGIPEVRITATRTGVYAGKDAAEFGELVTKDFIRRGKDGHEDAKVEVSYPDWCRVTVYKIVQGQRCAFVGPKVYWEEAYATEAYDSEVPNEMWRDRRSGQLEKCAEAAALRAAFPEELGGEYTAEEMHGRVIDAAQVSPGHYATTNAEVMTPPRPQRSEFEKPEPKAPQKPEAQERQQPDGRPEPPPVGEEVRTEPVAVQAEMQEPEAQETPINPHWAEAQEMLAKLEQNIREVGDAEMADYKASGRRIIDGFEGLSDEERDALRGQFTGMVMSEQQRRAQEKKGKRK